MKESPQDLDQVHNHPRGLRGRIVVSRVVVEGSNDVEDKAVNISMSPSRLRPWSPLRFLLSSYLSASTHPRGILAIHGTPYCILSSPVSAPTIASSKLPTVYLGYPLADHIYSCPWVLLTRANRPPTSGSPSPSQLYLLFAHFHSSTNLYESTALDGSAMSETPLSVMPFPLTLCGTLPLRRLWYPCPAPP